MGNAPTKSQQSNRLRKNVHWKNAVRPSPPGKPQLVPGTSDTKPDCVTIRWDRPRSDGGCPMTGFMVEHRRTGSPHWVRATPIMVTFPELTLSGLEPGWRYQFRVIAENAVGVSEPSELSEPLTVTLQRSAISAPRFTSELQDTIAIENEKVELKVEIIGTPTPEVCWFKDGFEIFSSRRTRIVTENNTSVLTIYQTSLNDEGEIKCTATNRAGHVVTKARLKLEAPPRIRLPRQYEEGLLFEAEDVIRLKVAIAGRPAPTITWSHNGDTLEHNDRHEILTTDKSACLRVSGARRTDRGEYQLKAVNSLGTDTAAFLVTITDKPQQPGKAVVTMTLGKSVTLSWSSPQDDGGCKIGNYIVEYYRVGWNVWLKAATCRQVSATLGDLIEGSEYKFRVKAESPYGVSEPSEESDVLFIPDPKRGILKPATRAKSQSEIFDCTETPPAVIPRRKRSPSAPASRSTLDEHIKPIQIETPSGKLSRNNKKSVSIVSPDVGRNNYSGKKSIKEAIANNVFDRTSVTRELSYGSPEVDYKKKEHDRKNLQSQQIPVQEFRRSPSPLLAVPKRPTNAANNEATCPRDNDDIIHNSSEFMLVLYPDQESKEQGTTGHRHSFDFGAEDSAPPSLSLSAPELGSEMSTMPPIRYAVSSTELLYERAMARFYQAVALEESEKARNRRRGIDRRSSEPPPKITIYSPEHNEISNRLQKENSILRSLVGDSAPQQVMTRQRKLSLTHSEDESKEKKNIEVSLVLNKSTITEDNTSDKFQEIVNESMDNKFVEQETAMNISVFEIEDDPVKPFKDDLEDDYTDSTASSDDESQDARFRLLFKKKMGDIEESTYHPRSMQPKSAQHGAVEDSTTTTPIFVPIPILKRRELVTANKEKVAPAKPERKSLKLESEDIDNRMQPNSIPHKDTDINTPQPISENLSMSAAEVARKRRLENRQDSLEETKVVIDFYGDIVREYGVGRKSPVRLNTEELKAAAEQTEMTENSNEIISTLNENTYSSLSKPAAEYNSQLKNQTKSKLPTGYQGTSSSSASLTRPMSSLSNTSESHEVVTSRKVTSKTRLRSESRSPSRALTKHPLPAENENSELLTRTVLKHRTKTVSRTRNESKSPTRERNTGLLQDSAHRSQRSRRNESKSPTMKGDFGSNQSSSHFRQANKRNQSNSPTRKAPLGPNQTSAQLPQRSRRNESNSPTRKPALGPNQTSAQLPQRSRRNESNSPTRKPALGPNQTSAQLPQRSRRNESNSPTRKPVLGPNQTSAQLPQRSRRNESNSPTRKPVLGPNQSSAQLPQRSRRNESKSPSRNKVLGLTQSRQRSESKSPTRKVIIGLNKSSSPVPQSVRKIRKTSQSPAPLYRKEGPQRSQLQANSTAGNRTIPRAWSESPDYSAGTRTPDELIEAADATVRSAVNYLTDLAMFIVACWLYFFKSEWLALPVLSLMMYRQLKDAIKNKIPPWMKFKNKSK